MIIEFDIITDILGPPNMETGEQKVIKKNVVYKKTFDSFNTTCEQFLNNKGNLVKSYTTLICNGTYYKAKHSYEYCKNKLHPIEIKGLTKHAKYIKVKKY